MLLEFREIFKFRVLKSEMDSPSNDQYLGKKIRKKDGGHFTPHFTIILESFNGTSQPAHNLILWYFDHQLKRPTPASSLRK